MILEPLKNGLMCLNARLQEKNKVVDIKSGWDVSTINFKTFFLLHLERLVLMCLFGINRVNVSAGPQEDRMMTTGLHTVSDIYCNSCLQIVGWKYVSY